MKRVLIAILMLAALPVLAQADEILLPVFAVNMPGGDGTAWSSEVYVTNRSSESATVTVGPFLPGRIDDKPPCQTLLQPFIIVPPNQTLLWRTGEIALGIGCPDFAAGGQLFYSDQSVTLTSRMVRHERLEGGDLIHPLSGLGQEIDAVNVLEFAKGEHRLILPSVGWHPNACGPRLIETNVFFTNPGSSAVRIEIDGGPEQGLLMVDGTDIDGSYVFELGPGRQRVLRLARQDSLLEFCDAPTVGAFSVTASGPVSAISSIIDRRSGDPRTAPALPLD